MVERRRRRWQTLVIVVVVVVLVAAGLAALVMKARNNYIAGRQALAAGQYGLAIQKLSAAEVIGRPYADAHALLSNAVALSMGQTQYVHDRERSGATDGRDAHAASRRHALPVG